MFDDLWAASMADGHEGPGGWIIQEPGRFRLVLYRLIGRVRSVASPRSTSVEGGWLRGADNPRPAYFCWVGVCAESWPGVSEGVKEGVNDPCAGCAKPGFGVQVARAVAVKNRCRACISHGRGDGTHAVWLLQRIHSPGRPRRSLAPELSAA